MKKIILIGSLLVLFSGGMFVIYAFSLDHSPGAVAGEPKKLVPALPLLGPCLMGLALIGLGILGVIKQREEQQGSRP